jgi:shikimate dehydrogenase
MRLGPRRAGIIGWPVEHSRSPALHKHWLTRYGIDGEYLRLPVPPDDLARRLRELAAEGFAGANLTIPHKEAGLALCDELDPSARRAGAVNTLVFKAGRITGSNTDGYGFIRNLLDHGIGPIGARALILGAGGSARAIGAALQDEGASIAFCNRTPARAAALAVALPPAGQVAWEHREAALADFTLLVNATSLGMIGQPPLDMNLTHAPPDLGVADIVYAPLQTPLLAAAAALGLRIAPGLGMLLHQAAPGFEAWFGLRPLVDDALVQAVLA